MFSPGRGIIVAASSGSRRPLFSRAAATRSAEPSDWSGPSAGEYPCPGRPSRFAAGKSLPQHRSGGLPYARRLNTESSPVGIWTESGASSGSTSCQRPGLLNPARPNRQPLPQSAPPSRPDAFSKPLGDRSPLIPHEQPCQNGTPYRADYSTPRASMTPPPDSRPPNSRTFIPSTTPLYATAAIPYREKRVNTG